MSVLQEASGESVVLTSAGTDYLQLTQAPVAGSCVVVTLHTENGTTGAWSLDGYTKRYTHDFTFKFAARHFEVWTRDCDGTETDQIAITGLPAGGVVQTWHAAEFGGSTFSEIASASATGTNTTTKTVDPIASGSGAVYAVGVVYDDDTPTVSAMALTGVTQRHEWENTNIQGGMAVGWDITTLGTTSVTATGAGQFSYGDSQAYLAVVALTSPTVVTPEIVFTINGVEFRDLSEKQVRIELNGFGSGAFRIYRGHPQATEANLAKGTLVSVTIPEIDPEPFFEFYIEEGDFELIGTGDHEGAEILAFSGAGSLKYLHRAIMYRVQYTDLATKVCFKSQGTWKWTDTTEGAILAQIVAEAQDPSRPWSAIPALTLNFDGTNDSDGVAWSGDPLTGTWKIPIGAYLDEAVLELVNAGLINVQMDPGLVLSAYRSLGVDRSSTTFAAGKVRLVKGVNISDELSRAMTGKTFGSKALIKLSSGFNYVTTGSVTGDPFLQERYFEVDTDDEDTARRIANAQMQTTIDEQESLLVAHKVPWPGDGPDDLDGLYLPGQPWTANGRYWVGDLVTLHTGTGEFDYDNETFRIYAITLTEDETGYLAPPILELNAPWNPPDMPDISGGTSAGGGSGGSGSTGAHTHDEYQIASLDAWKQPVRCVATSPVTISTGLNAGDVIDGVTLAAGDRVLLTAQADPAENGIWIAGTTPTRAFDFDDEDEVVGAVVLVVEGTANALTLWRVENTTEPVIDTDAITISQVSSSSGPLSNYAATTDPTATDDDGDGYEVGSRWVNTSSGEEFVCVDASTGAAVWTSTTDQGAGGSVATDTIWDTKGDLAVGTGADTASKLAAGTDGYGLVSRSGEATGLKWEARTVAIAFVIDGAGSAITTGAKGFLKVPFACTITESEIESDTSTTTTLTIKKRAYGGGAASSIVAAALPTLTAATENKDSTLTGWTTSVSAGDKLYWEVTSNNNATRLTSTLTATRT